MRRKSAHRLEAQGSIFQTNSDTEVIVHLIALSKEQTLPDAMADALRRVEGAFSLVMISSDRIFAARDPRGFRPLAMGRIPAPRRAAAGHDRVCLRDLRLRSDRRDLRARGQAGRIGDRRTRRHHFAVLCAGGGAVELHFRARVFLAARQHGLWTSGAGQPRRSGTPTGAGSSGRCRSRRSRAGLRRDRGRGLRRRERHSVSLRTDPQSLRGTHLHRAAAKRARLRSEAEAESGAHACSKASAWC